MEVITEPAVRRLLKARAQDMEKLEIRTKSLSASINYLEATRFTFYKLQIQPTHAPAKSSWTLAKRYSDFYAFRADLLTRLRKLEKAHDSATSKTVSEERAFVRECLQRHVLEVDFPKKYLRSDNEAITAERRTKLQEFVRGLLDAYAEMAAYLYNRQCAGSSTCENDGEDADLVKQTYARIEKFLMVPESQKEADRRQAAAILALEDASEVAMHASDSEHTCCICLDGEEEEAEGNRMVGLPCRHLFHEDCVIDWFSASVTCPLCRQPAYDEEAPAFDVSIN